MFPPTIFQLSGDALTLLTLLNSTQTHSPQGLSTLKYYKTIICLLLSESSLLAHSNKPLKQYWLNIECRRANLTSRICTSISAKNWLKWTLHSVLWQLTSWKHRSSSQKSALGNLIHNDLIFKDDHQFIISFGFLTSSKSTHVQRGEMRKWVQRDISSPWNKLEEVRKGNRSRKKETKRQLHICQNLLHGTSPSCLAWPSLKVQAVRFFPV